MKMEYALELRCGISKEKFLDLIYVQEVGLISSKRITRLNMTQDLRPESTNRRIQKKVSLIPRTDCKSVFGKPLK